ncbi:MAG: IS1595 family transposase [Flavobacteriales bacterium]|nr:IS1595 family transposase [Flavobacteriales bacterium]
MAVNILELNKTYNSQLKCLNLLSKLRWGGSVKCTNCHKTDVRLYETKSGRYFCRSCKTQFSVFTDTIFEGTLLPLPTWFQIIGLMLNAKSSISAKEIERNTGVTYKTAYYVCMRIRVGMLMPETMLNGMIEMDESYFGGKPRKANKSKEDSQPNLSTPTTLRGRGTNKVSVVGMVERQGNIKTKVIEKLTKRNLLAMLKNNAKKEDSVLITDGFKSYIELEKYIDRLVVNHNKEFSRGIINVNTIEGFWSNVKNGIKGSYRAISKKYLPLYLCEFEWKFNHRNFSGNEFETYLRNALEQEKELLYWKAKSSDKVKKIAYEK